ncbi:MAG TPA: AAA family ATPase [Kofleriaceae bacterium]
MVAASTSSAQSGKPLLHICYAPADHAWVHGRMVRELGLEAGQYHTRADDGLGELQLAAIERAVDECRFTVLVASTSARWNKLARFAADLAQHRGLEDQAPRLIIVARDFALDAAAAQTQLSLGQRALVGLDCSDEDRTVESMARLRRLLALKPPVDEPPACPYPGLARFTAANRDLLFGRDGDRDALLQRIRAGHTRILVVGPSGTGKSSLVHAAVLPELSPEAHLAQVVPRGGDLAAALRTTIDALEVPDLGAAFDEYLAVTDDVTDAQIEAARARLCAVPAPDLRRRVVVVDPLEEIFAQDDAASRARLFQLLGGLWSLPWCTVILCMRADFYGAVMVERCWRELESYQYPVVPLDEAGLRAAIAEPARHAGVHVDGALVERLIREVDRDRSSAALPLLQVALKELWTHLRWRYLTLADYERIVSHDPARPGCRARGARRGGSATVDRPDRRWARARRCARWCAAAWPRSDFAGDSSVPD